MLNHRESMLVEKSMALYYDFKGMKGIAQGASGSLLKSQKKSIKT